MNADSLVLAQNGRRLCDARKTTEEILKKCRFPLEGLQPRIGRRRRRRFDDVVPELNFCVKILRLDSVRISNDAHADVDADLVPDFFFDVDARDELGRGLQRRDEHLRGHRVAVADVAVVVAG